VNRLQAETIAWVATTAFSRGPKEKLGFEAFDDASSVGPPGKLTAAFSNPIVPFVIIVRLN
jgi:hypothetical protein